MGSFSSYASYIKANQKEWVGPVSIFRLLDKVAESLAILCCYASDFARADNTRGSDTDDHLIGVYDSGRAAVPWDAQLVLWRGVD